MTSKEVAKCEAAESRRRSPLDHLPPPANSNKPLTPFSIEDILSKPSVKRSYALCGAAHLLSSAEKQQHQQQPQHHHHHRAPGGPPLSGRALLNQTSPLCALEELASKTFKGLEVSVLQAAEGRDGMTLFGQRSTPKKRRKSRTAFTNHQIYELEKRFLYQKYLSPADRDQIAQQLGLTNAQVITWFQNRRAKLKRDLEEMKADVESAKAIGQVPLDKLAKLADLEKCANGTLGHGRADSPAVRGGAAGGGAGGGGGGGGGGAHRERELALGASPPSPFSDRTTSKECSEDEDVEIDVDD